VLSLVIKAKMFTASWSPCCKGSAFF